MARNCFQLAVLFAFALLSLGDVRPASAANQVVSDCGDSASPNAHQLRAILQADQSSGVSLNTITFTCGPTLILTAGQLPFIRTPITIDGGNVITLSGNNASRLFYVQGGTLTLSHLTVTKGVAAGDGGAIYVQSGTLNVNSSKFLDNQATTAGNGGAILSLGVLNITDSEFAGNKAAASGGALLPSGAGSVTTITGSSFHDNQALSNVYGGGAILFSEGAAATIRSSTLSANKAHSGAAIYLYQSSGLVVPVTTLTVTANSRLNGNIADSQGGGIFDDYGTMYLTGATIRGNSALQGGGIYMGIFNSSTANASLANATISGNQASDGGGGIFDEYGTVALANVTLSANAANINGGGLFNKFGAATLTNATLSGNATSEGGAIYEEYSTEYLTNVTFSGNSANVGGGISAGGGEWTFRNTLFAKGTSGDNCANYFSGGSFSLSDDASCGFAAGGGQDSVSDLRLGLLTNNGGPTLTHMPRPGSPAIDGGTALGCPSADQRGAARSGPFTGIACDVGAVEAGAQLPWAYLPFLRR